MKKEKPVKKVPEAVKNPGLIVSEIVEDGDLYTTRIPVPGGWMYRSYHKPFQVMGAVFVPERQFLGDTARLESILASIKSRRKPVNATGNGFSTSAFIINEAENRIYNQGLDDAINIIETHLKLMK